MEACLALREEGVEVVLINNNPATVMTDEACADVVYFEPLTVETGKHPIIVHGGGPAINEMLTKLEIPSTFIDGRLVVRI